MLLQQTAVAVDIPFSPDPIKPPPASHMTPDWWDEELPNNYVGRCRQVIRSFVTGKVPSRAAIKHTNMNGRHIYSVRKNGTELWMFKNNRSIKVRVCVARKVNGAFIGNSSSLVFLRGPVTKQNPNPKVKNAVGGQLKIQEVMGEVMPMVPFGLFKEQMMNIETLQMIDRGPEEMVDGGRRRRGEDIKTHFMGAMLFKIEFFSRSRAMRDHRGEGMFFLFDIDRNDLKLKNLNFFLSRLPRPCTSIADAYARLKPKEVYDAERFLGRECTRQGEWFFIPVQGNHKPNGQTAILQAKGNRAHYVDQLCDAGYVRGEVRHGGREHEPIELKGWHKPVCNTAISSFKISGAVD